MCSVATQTSSSSENACARSCGKCSTPQNHPEPLTDDVPVAEERIAELLAYRRQLICIHGQQDGIVAGGIRGAERVLLPTGALVAADARHRNPGRFECGSHESNRLTGSELGSEVADDVHAEVLARDVRDDRGRTRLCEFEQRKWLTLESASGACPLPEPIRRAAGHLRKVMTEICTGLPEELEEAWKGGLAGGARLGQPSSEFGGPSGKEGGRWSRRACGRRVYEFVVVRPAQRPIEGEARECFCPTVRQFIVMIRL